eukprot:gene12161-15273_t
MAEIDNAKGDKAVFCRSPLGEMLQCDWTNEDEAAYKTRLSQGQYAHTKRTRDNPSIESMASPPKYKSGKVDSWDIFNSVSSDVMSDPDEEDSDCFSSLHSSDAEYCSLAGEMDPTISAALLACHLSRKAGYEFAFGNEPSLEEVLAIHFLSKGPAPQPRSGTQPQIQDQVQIQDQNQIRDQDQTQSPVLQTIPPQGVSVPGPPSQTLATTSGLTMQVPYASCVLASLLGFIDPSLEERFCQYRGFMWDQQPWTTTLLKLFVLFPLVAVLLFNQHYKTCSAGYLKVWHVMRMVVMATLAMLSVPTKQDMLLAYATDLAGSVVEPILARDGFLINFLIALVQSMYFSMSPLAPPLQTVLLVFMVHATCIVVRFCVEVKSRQGFLKLKKE